MANLIKCPTCAADISAAAVACPKCGHPIAPQRPIVVKQKPQTNMGCAIVLFGLLAFFIYALVQSDDGSAPGASTPAAPALPASECQKDLHCIGEKLTSNVDVMIACKHQVDAQAKNDSQWDDGILSPVFAKYGWADKPGGNVRLVGDRVKFQNGFGAFLRMIYVCTVDPNGNNIVSAEVFQGKLE